MPKKATYSDGDVEIELLNFFKTTPIDKRSQAIANILSEDPSWALTYHLSPIRENLLNWMPVSKDSRALEVGSGCGALTGILAEKCKSVVALELSEQRTAVNRARNSHKKNLTFEVINLEDYDPSEKFDIITCIGVLEYAGMFIDSKKPYETFLKKLKSLLNPGGVVVIAIENRLGIKYLSGAREDHTGRFYDSIEDYPLGTKIKTFGRRELTEKLNRSGFAKTDFYFPFPDYKMPIFVHSEDFINENFYFPYSAFPTPSPDQGRLHIFNEQLSIKQFIDNGLYPDIANSFLVLAKAGN